MAEVEWNQVTGWPSQVIDEILEDIEEKYNPGFWRELGKLSITSPRNQDFKPPSRHNTKIFSQKIGPNSRERNNT